MNIGRKTLVIAVFGALALVAYPATAHPGNTAADGCHYCRTNCAKWGEVYNERHCHGGGVAAPVVPATTKKPVPTKVVTPTPSPTPLPTPSPTPEEPTPTPEGDILGTVDEVIPTPTTPVSIPVTTPTSSDNSGLGVAAMTLVALAASGGAYTLYRRKKNSA